MLMVLSPAKSLDFDTPPHVPDASTPDFIHHAADLIRVLQDKTPADIRHLMDLSDKLAALNVARYAAWPDHATQDAKQAVLAFNGDVYEGLDARSLGRDDLAFSQRHLRVLSGLYGLLRPLDRIRPYRLEMGTSLTNPRGKDLYAFWGDTLTDTLQTLLDEQGASTLVNLASDEYFRAVRAAKLKARVVQPVFEDWKNGKYKIISFYAKRARGLMARYAIQKRITDPEALRDFNVDGYAYTPDASDERRWIFRRIPA